MLLQTRCQNHANAYFVKSYGEIYPCCGLGHPHISCRFDTQKFSNFTWWSPCPARLIDYDWMIYLFPGGTASRKSSRSFGVSETHPIPTTKTGNGFPQKMCTSFRKPSVPFQNVVFRRANEGNRRIRGAYFAPDFRNSITGIRNSYSFSRKKTDSLLFAAFSEATFMNVYVRSQSHPDLPKRCVPGGM